MVTKARKKVEKILKKVLTGRAKCVIIQTQAEGSPTGGGEGGDCLKGYKMITKIFSKKLKKMLDFLYKVCYNTDTIKKGDKKRCT